MFAVVQSARVHDDLDESVLAAGDSQGKCGAAYMPPGLACCDGLTLYPPGETKCCWTGTGLLGVKGVPCAMLAETSASDESLDEHAVQTQGMCGAVAIPKGLACCDGLTLYPPGQTSCCWTGTGLLTAKGIKCVMLVEEAEVAETETTTDLEGNMTVLHETNVDCGGGAFKSCPLPAPGIGSCCCGNTCSCGAAPSCCGKQCGAPPPAHRRRRTSPPPPPSPAGKCGAAVMPPGLKCCDDLTLYPPGETECCNAGNGLLTAKGVPCAMLSQTSASDESLDEHSVESQGWCGAAYKPPGFACCDKLTLYQPQWNKCCWKGTGQLDAVGGACWR